VSVDVRWDCGGGGGWVLRLSGPDELAILVSLGQNAYEARLAIKNSSYILWCDALFCHVVVTAKHIWSSEACPVRTCRRLTRVIVLRGVSWSRALFDRLVLGVNCQAESW
jgi:hypothetical protein